MTRHDACCDGFQLTRRALLGGGLAAAVGMSVFGETVLAPVFGAPGEKGSVLVVLSLRGGADGLSLVVPHAESSYYGARPSTAVDAQRLLHRDATFGLHPALAPLSDMWSSGRLAALQAIGLPAPNRSHFDAIQQVEDADPGSRERSGWLNRFVAALAPAEGTFEGTQVGSNLLPFSLYGAAPTIAMQEPGALRLPFADDPRGPSIRRGLRAMYGRGRDDLRDVGARALGVAAAADDLTAAVAAPPANGTTYPVSDLGRALRTAAGLIRSPLGVRAVTVDHGSWDHHQGLAGLVAMRASELASAVSAFYADLGEVGDRVTLVTLSEFGRRLAENGAAGCDHGYGNAVLVAGGGVRGGRYYGRWPGLARDALNEGDLQVTTDYRHVLTEIIRSRFPAISTADVFPAAGYQPLGFMRRPVQG